MKVILDNVRVEGEPCLRANKEKVSLSENKEEDHWVGGQKTEVRGDAVIMSVEQEVGRAGLVGELSTLLGTDKIQRVSDNILPGISWGSHTRII